MTEKTLLGFDAGMGALKMYSASGPLEFVSQVALRRGRHMGRVHGLRAARPPIQVTVHNAPFYVGPHAHEWGRAIEHLDYEKLIGSPEMRALLYGAWTRYALRDPGLLERPMSVIVGLPIEPLSGDEAAGNVAAVKRWLSGRHTWTARLDDREDTYAVEVTEVAVTAQPVGALFDYLLDDEGHLIPGRKAAMKAEVGVVSVGFNTLELLVVRDRRPVPDMSHGARIGVRRLLQLADGQGLYTLGQLDAMLRTGSLDVRDALDVWEREIWSAIAEWWGDTWRRFRVVLVVGGGALLLGERLTRRFRGKAFVPQQPVMSIARGLHKMARQRENRRRRRQEAARA